MPPRPPEIQREMDEALQEFPALVPIIDTYGPDTPIYNYHDKINQPFEEAITRCGGFRHAMLNAPTKEVMDMIVASANSLRPAPE